MCNYFWFNIVTTIPYDLCVIIFGVNIVTTIPYDLGVVIFGLILLLLFLIVYV